jgi:hypothetical protein
MSMALRTRPPTDLSAASVEINLNDTTDGSYLQSTVAFGQRAGRDAWRWYNEIGEVHYAISRSARIAGYMDVLAVEFGPDGKVVETIDTGQPAEIAQSIYSPYGGVRGFVERYYTLLKVPGDMYLTKAPKGDGYHLASPDELDVQSFSWWSKQRGSLKSVRLTTVPAAYGKGLGDGNGDLPPFSRDISPEEFVGRLWSPSKRFVDTPESALHALDTECEALRDLTLSIKAQLRSRFALAGLLVLPPGMSMATSVKGKGRVAGQVPEATVDLIVAAMTRNVRNLDEAQALLPIILRAAHPDDGEKIKHIILDRKIFETDLELRRELIGRILQALDSNQDAVKGTSDQSHFGAWASADEERRVAITPDLEGLCWSLTRLVMQKQLRASTPRKGNIGIWYDLSRASMKSNMQEDARQAWDRILVSDPAARRMSGIPESDAPDDAERVRAAGRLVKNPMLMLYGTPEYDSIDWDKVGEWNKSTGPAPDTPADDPEAGPGEGEPGSQDDRETDTPRTERPA